MSESTHKKFTVASVREMISNAFRLGEMIWKDKKKLVVGFLFVSIVSSLFPITNAAVRGGLINELIVTSQAHAISHTLLLFTFLTLFVSLISSLVNALDWYLDRLFYLYLEEMTQLMIIRKLGSLDVAHFESPKQKDLLQKVTENGVWRVQNFVENQFYLLRRIIEIGMAAVALSFAQWWVFIVIMIGVLPSLFVELKYGERTWSIHGSKGETKRRFWHARSKFEDVASMVELKIFQNISHFLSLIKELFESFHVEQYGIDKKRFHEELIASLTEQASYAIIYVYLIERVVFTGMPVGTFTFFLGAVGSLSGAIGGFFNMIGRGYQNSLFVSDVFKLMDTHDAIEKPIHGIVLDKKKTPSIIFDHVSFAYPDSERIILKDISLAINPGEKIALVGLNGAGKTTFIKLLCRFYDPTNGTIYVDGQDLKQIDIESYYSLIGALFQDYTNYSFITKEAIAIGNRNKPLSMERVKQSAIKSESKDFIENWDKQYEQQLGREFTEGVEPSIGQWQKLALARTFYRDPRILILDEPTSSIDAEAEANIFEKLEKLPKNRTVILISHRFSTVRHAHRIVVFEQGRITEIGTHEQLLERNKMYARLFKLQAEGYR